MSEYRILWDTSLAPKPIHPAIDLVDDHLYFGLLLPVEGESVTQGLCFVRDDGEHFVATTDELESRRLFLKYPAVMTQLRWKLEGIKEFVEGTACTSCTSILDEIIDVMKKYIDLSMDEREYVLVALWIIGTYLQPVWISYPYIGISGAKRCGKSKFLKFNEMLAFNAIFSTNISTPTLYRLIQSLRCTILMDEAEALSNAERKTELKNILYSGYKKYGFVYRTGKVTKDQIPVPERFEVFSPKIFVTYEGLEEILNDRSINIVMIRTENKEISDREIDENDPIWIELRHKLYIFALKNWREIREIYRTMEPIPEIHSRDLELWKPILALAKFFGDNVFEQIKGLALKKIKEKEMREEVETREVILLSTLVEMVQEDGFYAIVDIKEKIKELYGEEFSTDWIGKTLAQKFGFQEATRLSRKGRPTARRLTVERVRELAKRYGAIRESSEKAVHDVQAVQTGEGEYSDESLIVYARDLWNKLLDEASIIKALVTNRGISEDKAKEILEVVKKQYGKGLRRLDEVVEDTEKEVGEEIDDEGFE